MNNKIWLDLQALIDDQLRLQVQISFRHHHTFLQENGLGQCQKVMDLGTGNGLFLQQVALNHPRINFIGIDNQLHMIAQAQKSNLRNVQWDTWDANKIGKFSELSKIDGVIMRYFILHLPHMEGVLRDLANRLKKGAMLWIFDLDLNHFRCNPSHPVFDQIRQLVKTFCDRFSIDSQAGTLLPPLLERSGFRVMQNVAEPFGNRTVDPSQFQKFLSQEVELYWRFLNRDLHDPDFLAMNDFIRTSTVHSGYTIQYGMVMLSAQKI
jgi:ubiquinone/menaquinone biosynthesis C-methylase UbiE